MRIAVISDHLAAKTGFSVATRPFVDKFLDLGWDVHYYGIIGQNLEYHDKRVKMVECPSDENMIPEGLMRNWLLEVRPDIVFAVRDPGTLNDWCDKKNGIVDAWTQINSGMVDAPLFKTVFYIPIEGLPMSRTFNIGFSCAQMTRGALVFYTPGAMEVVNATFPHVDCRKEFVYHGLDHFPENAYSQDDRDLLRRMAGIEDRFIVTSVGANKRTKGLVETIYTARAYKELTRGKGKAIFYLHTEAYDPIFGGHDLHGLAMQYGVSDICIFKPRRNVTEGKSVFDGVPVTSDSIIDTLIDFEKSGFIPQTKEDAYSVLKTYGLTEIFAMSDVYLDLSTVEGWGLPVGEAMRFGLPVIGVSDLGVRDEIYGADRIIIQPEDEELWDTLGSGARLVKARPSDVAKTIGMIEIDRSILTRAIEAGKARSSRYKWAESTEKMARIIQEVHNGQS